LEAQTAQEERTRRLLIADDDPVSLGFLQTATESLGCAAVTAANGTEALNLADASVIELLLIDLHMPDIGGTALLQALRARGMRAPAIATSAGFETSAADALRAAGFEDRSKPASLAAIERLLRQHLTWMSEQVLQCLRTVRPARCRYSTIQARRRDRG
jgi:CheY-like chemotaxis protein